MAHVVVVGGGLAGLTAALDLMDRGERVTLLESRARLGGLTTSFTRDGLWVDNGQHVFLRCCTEYRALLARLGVADLVDLQPRLSIPMRSATDGRTYRLQRGRLRAPLHLAKALLRHPWLSPRERWDTARTALALSEVDPISVTADQMSFGHWLADHGADPRSIETVWDLVGLATLNARADDTSLALAATVFQIGLLTRHDGADIGWARVPLHRLHGQAALSALRDGGAQVSLRSRVRALRRDDAGWHVALDDGSIDATDVVLAVPPRAAARLVPPSTLGLEGGFADRLGTSPIINLHLVLDRRVLDTPFLAAVDSPLQWIFDRTAASGLTQGQYLAVSLSAAYDLVGEPVDALRTWAMPHLHRVLPALRDAVVCDFFVTREPHATFRPAPGCRRDRPHAASGTAGLAIAGAWADTGWPATMEGAVRSGHAASQAIPHTTALRRDEVAA